MIFELMQRIFKYGAIQYTSLTRDKEPNISIHGMPSCGVTAVVSFLC